MQQPNQKPNDQFTTLNLNYDLDGLYDALYVSYSNWKHRAEGGGVNSGDYISDFLSEHP